MATHCSQAMQALSSNVGRPRMSSPSILIAPFGQIDVQGLQGISWEQWKIGKTPASCSGISSVMTAPGRAFRTSAVRSHSAGTSPTSRPSIRAISVPLIFPVNIAALASAISSASPAPRTGRPNSFAFFRNSSTGSRPTATRSVSHLKVFSVPGTTFQDGSSFAMVTLSTSSFPFAETIVWRVWIGTPILTSLSLWTL